jgi:hypothetical protein
MLIDPKDTEQADFFEDTLLGTVCLVGLSIFSAISLVFGAVLIQMKEKAKKK